MRIALLGNPNSGKSTLFNALTGLSQHVGNFPGVTVEQHTGRMRALPDSTLIDLPGTYSLSAISVEEAVCRDALLQEPPDAIVNIIDATCISRGLYMTLQLLELGIPMVVALNMMDEVQKSGGYIDCEVLSKDLGVPVLPISAVRGTGIPALVDALSREAQRSAAKGRERQTIRAPSPGAVDDRRIQERYARIDRIVARAATGFDSGAILSHTRQLDAVCMHPVFALPVFLLIMGVVFYCTFGPVGQWMTKAFGLLLQVLTGWLSSALRVIQVAEWVHALVIEGILAGIGIVLSFLPTLLILFFLLSLLEDSGYMARMVYVSDKFFRKVGLSGRSFVPALLGFGCSVPAMMATRTLSSRRDRYATILLVPFLSCSAKLPIYALLANVFFRENALWVVMGLYVGGALLGLIAAWALSRAVFPVAQAPFLLELPNYRWPTMRSALMLVRARTAVYVRNALTTLLLASVAVWSLQRVDVSLRPVLDNSRSILAILGRMLSPLFAPLGFGNWQAATSLLTGLVSKEGVLTTMGILLSAPTETALQDALAGVFTPLSALSFLVFVLLYMPCMAAFATARRELGGLRYALINSLFHIGIAWLAACIVYNAGRLIITM